MDLTHTLNPDNSSDALRLRKSENNLIIVGMGIMLFGLWNLTKTLSILFLNQSIFAVGLSLAAKGIGTLIYYFQMARSMVGGKLILYRGLIILDLGLLICTLAGEQGIYLILCTTGVNAVAGVFSILRAREAKEIGSSDWILSLGHGILLIALMGGVIFSWIFQNEPTIAVYIYAGSLILTAIKMIVESCKKTAIVYIQ